MSSSRLVLDNSILSALATASWFDAPAFYASSHEIVVSSRIWKSEFVPHHGVESPLAWLAIEETELESIRTQALGQLSRPDWSCIQYTWMRSGYTKIGAYEYNQMMVVWHDDSGNEDLPVARVVACGVMPSESHRRE